MIEFIPLTEDHLELVLSWRIRPEINRYFETDVTYDLDEQKRWYKKVKNDKNSIYWLIKFKGQLVGLNSINNINWVNQYCFGTYYLADPKIRALIGFYVPHITLNYIFSEMDMNKSIANIFTVNSNVVQLYLKIGYRKVGVLKDHIFKNDKRYDMVYLEFLKKDWKMRKKYFDKFKGNFFKR